MSNSSWRKEGLQTSKLTDIDLDMFYHFDIAWMDAAHFYQSLLNKNGKVVARKLKGKETLTP